MNVQTFAIVHPHITLFLMYAILIFLVAFAYNPWRAIRVTFTLLVALPVSAFLMVTSKILERLFSQAEKRQGS